MVVGVKVGGAFEPKVSAEINYLAAESQERNGELSSDAMRKSQKDDLGLFGQQLGFGFAETKLFGAGMVGKFREDLRETLSGVLAGGDGGQFDMRMRKEQADEFFAGVP
jgi:hypothetical protein